jgi:hypothetical protein
MTIRFEESRLFVDVANQTAYDAVRAAPLPVLFSSRVGPFPPVKEVTGESGEWGTELGQTRRIILGDGGTTLETLVGLDPPRSYAYRLSEITGPLRLVVAGVGGQFSFAAESGGTRVTWSWDVEPRSGLATPLVLVLRRFWHGYAVKALVRAEALVPR